MHGELAKVCSGDLSQIFERINTKKMKIEFQDRIDNYLLGRMSEEDCKSFEQELERNDELRGQTKFSKDVQNATKSRNEKLKKMEEWKNDYVWQHDCHVAKTSYNQTGSGYDYCPAPPLDQTFTKPRSSGKRFFYFISGIAAIFIAGFFLFNRAFYGSKSDIEIIYSPLSTEHGNIRGGDSFEEIEKLLVDKDYKDALSKIEKEETNLQKHNIDTDSIKDVEQREYEKVIIKLDFDKLCWMKVYALLGLDRRSEAIELLEEMRANNNTYKDQADSIYHLVK